MKSFEKLKRKKDIQIFKMSKFQIVVMVMEYKEILFLKSLTLSLLYN